MSDSRSISTSIAQLAARQYGHVARRQLLALGLRAGAIDHRVRVGSLIVVHAGVYAVGYRRVEPVALAAAAVLAGGGGTVLSHDSAAALWGLRRWPRTPEILAPGCVRQPGIRAHRSTTLTAADLSTQLGVRTTTAGRALADIRSRLRRTQFTRLVNRARLDGHLSTDAADALLAGRATARPTRSGLEDAFGRFVARHHLPRPLINARVPETGHEVDALYPEQRVIVELDDYETHGDRATFASDRERDAAHAVLGYATLRLIRERLTAGEAARLRELLARRAA